MNSPYHRVLLISVLIGSVAGCASQGSRPDGDLNPLCAAIGGVIGGGTAAAITIAAGPIGAGVGVGALLGALACQQDNATRTVAVTQTATTPPPAPAPAAPMAAPDPDSDGDSVVDSLDRCPGTPPGTRVDANGCPDILLSLTGINFRFDSAQIDPASSDILDRAVATLATTRDVALSIEGHCDSIGTDAYNLALSQRRAEAVRAFLVEHGVAASRLTAVGRGEAQPVAPNDTEQGRFQNRRVEFRVQSSAAGARSGAETWRDVDHSVMTQPLADPTPAAH